MFRWHTNVAVLGLRAYSLFLSPNLVSTLSTFRNARRPSLLRAPVLSLSLRDLCKRALQCSHSLTLKCDAFESYAFLTFNDRKHTTFRYCMVQKCSHNRTLTHGDLETLLVFLAWVPCTSHPLHVALMDLRVVAVRLCEVNSGLSLSPPFSHSLSHEHTGVEV